MRGKKNKNDPTSMPAADPIIQRNWCSHGAGSLGPIFSTFLSDLLLFICLLEKKVTVSGPQLAKTIIKKTLDSHA